MSPVTRLGRTCADPRCRRPVFDEVSSLCAPCWYAAGCPGAAEPAPLAVLALVPREWDAALAHLTAGRPTTA